MSITPPPITPTPLTGFPLASSGYTNVTPLTFRDGLTYLLKLEHLACYVRDTLVPFVDESFTGLDDAWKDEVTALVNSVNVALAAQSTLVNDNLAAENAHVDQEIADLTTFVNDAVDSIINGSVTVNDPILTQIISNTVSAARVLLDSLYVNEGDFTPVKAEAHAAHIYLNAKLDGAAKGDGATDDTAALQASINAAANGTLFIPAGTYMVNANLLNHIGLTVTSPKTRIILDKNATLKAITNASDNYVVISVQAADCTIEGGTIQGDVSTHTATTGEWGHLIVVDAGGDRCTIRDVTVKEAWGDGITVQRGPADVSIINVTADSNRRQGLSITGSTRTQVIGGRYKNTGAIGVTAPAAGIDVEPNPGSGYDVIDCVISSVIVSGNKGPGILTIRANTQTTDVQIDNCKANNNGSGVAGFPYSNFAARGSGNGPGRTRFTNCVSVNAGLYGFELLATGAEAVGCRSRASAQHGFEMSGVGVIAVDCNAEENNQHGFHIAATASAAMLLGGVSQANSQGATNTYDNVYVDVTGNVRIIGHNAYAGSLASKPKYGFEIAVGAGVRMFGCDISGTYGTANFLNASTSTIVPLPGFTKAALMASPTSPSATYVQAEAQSMKTAVDAIRTALASYGITG